jgi:hypothetical protein
MHHQAQKQLPAQPGEGGKPDGVALGVQGNGVVGAVGVADGEPPVQFCWGQPPAIHSE